jgi:hypothetical protein
VARQRGAADAERDEPAAAMQRVSEAIQLPQIEHFTKATALMAAALPSGSG